MSKLIFLIIGTFSLFLLGGCVEDSTKYKALQAQVDSLNNTLAAQNTEMESMFSGLNEITAGMRSIREAESILSIESSAQTEKGKKGQQQISQLKNDIEAISGAINTYKEQIAQLEGRNKRQSAEFKKLIANLQEELENKNQRIEAISKQLANKEKELGVKTKQIAKLNEDVATLNEVSTTQKETINQQDQTINTVFYLLGSKKELKKANVISRQGIFCPPVVSSQAQQANFISMDMRQVKSIPLHDKRAKLLSVHPADSYVLEVGRDGNLTLVIKNENSFWKQTKYLVVMVG